VLAGTSKTVVRYLQNIKGKTISMQNRIKYSTLIRAQLVW